MLRRPLTLALIAVLVTACHAPQGPAIREKTADPEDGSGVRRAISNAGEGGWMAYRSYSFNPGSDAILGTDGNKAWEISRYLILNPGYRVAIDGNNPRRAENVRQALIEAGVPAGAIYSGAYGEPRLMRDDRVIVLIGG